MVVSLLAGLLVLALLGLASLLAKLLRDLSRQQQKDRDQFIKAFDRLQELQGMEYVSSHLRKFGVGPYLPTAAERISQDVAETMDLLGLSEEDAKQYLVTGFVRRDGQQPERTAH